MRIGTEKTSECLFFVRLDLLCFSYLLPFLFVCCVYYFFVVFIIFWFVCCVFNWFMYLFVCCVFLVLYFLCLVCAHLPSEIEHEGGIGVSE